jgi:hypothetical protein
MRGRIRRGTLPLKREGESVCVLLGAPLDDGTTGDQPYERTDTLIAELQDQVRSLEEANRENRRIIAALTSRIPAIEALQEAQESPETVEDEGERAERVPVRGPRCSGGRTAPLVVAECVRRLTPSSACWQHRIGSKGCFQTPPQA